MSLDTLDFDEVVEGVKMYLDFIPVSDWYHLIKDLRGRFARNNISMFKGAPIFNAKQLNEYLELDEIVLNAKGPAAMRDDLALHVFNSRNLSILSEKEEFCAFAFILPYTLVTIAIQSLKLTREARYTLIKITFNVIILLRQYSRDLRSRKSKKTPNVEVKFAEEMSSKRTINTLIALAYVLRFYGDNLSLSRLFTHTVEYIFGYMRRLSYGKDKSEVAINALSKQQISKSILTKYNLDPYYVRGRIYPWEDNQNDITNGRGFGLKEISYDQIPNEVIELINGNTHFENTQTSLLLSSFILENTPSEIPSLNTRMRDSDAIRSRQIAYCGK